MFFTCALREETVLTPSVSVMHLLIFLGKKRTAEGPKLTDVRKYNVIADQLFIRLQN